MKTMSITIDDRLYTVLKRTAGPRGMSGFISRALTEKLGSARRNLRAEYLSAKKDRGREEVLRDWDAISAEDWR
jgi:hypothetical protein